MLGEQIGEETGKVMVRRVISVDGGTKVEVTVQSTGKLLGIETRNNVTYLAGIRPDGSLYGEAQGLVVGKGGEQATFKAAGVGKLLADGAVSYRGASYYYSDAPNFRRLRVQRRRRREHQEQVLGVEVGRGFRGNIGAARTDAAAPLRARATSD